MSEQHFQPGEIVDISIKGVRISDTSHIRVAIQDESGEVWVLPPQAAITRIAPAEWPPRPGDLWRDKHGELWFIHKSAFAGQGDDVLMGRTANGLRWAEDADVLLADNSPMTLVRREEDEAHDADMSPETEGQPGDYTPENPEVTP